jgi:heme-degrading monooxygenase HmoA
VILALRLIALGCIARFIAARGRTSWCHWWRPRASWSARCAPPCCAWHWPKGCGCSRVGTGASDAPMILEVAVLKVRVGESGAFELAFARAQSIISSMPGYISHQLQGDVSNHETRLVQWREPEDHTIGFRQSPQYQDWKRLLHHFYEPFPTVEHYETVFATQGAELRR